MADDESDDRALWESWIAPNEAITLLRRPDLQFETAAKTIGDRIRAGLIDTMAGHAINPDGTDKRTHVTLTTKLWSYWTPLESYDFWRTGDVEISKPGTTGYGDSTVLVCLFGVRLNPENVKAILPTSRNAPTQEPQSLNTSKPLPPLPAAELKRTATAIHAGWSTITEADAWTKAKLMNPEHKVARERFLDEYRVIRGHKTPGKQPQSGN